MPATMLTVDSVDGLTVAQLKELAAVAIRHRQCDAARQRRFQARRRLAAAGGAR